MPSNTSLKATVVWLRGRLRLEEERHAAERRATDGLVLALTARADAAEARAADAEARLAALVAQGLDDDDNNDKETPLAPRAGVGANLRELWLVEGRPARHLPGAHAGARRRESGPAMVRDAAQKILAAATPLPLADPAARPCLLAPVGSVENRGRPTQSMTIPADGGRPPRQFQAAYHVTWCAAAGQSPPVAAVALEYSHLCHQKRCVEPSHGTWEAHSVNTSREACRAAAAGGGGGDNCAQLSAGAGAGASATLRGVCSKTPLTCDSLTALFPI